MEGPEDETDSTARFRMDRLSDRNPGIGPLTVPVGPPG